MSKRKGDKIEVLFREIKKLKKEIRRKPQSSPPQSSSSASVASSRDSSPTLHNQSGDLRMLEELLFADTINEPPPASPPPANDGTVSEEVIGAVTQTVDDPQPGPSMQILNDELQINTESATEELPILTDEILEILGVDPLASTSLGKDIQKDLAARLEHFACNGLNKELRKELRERYLIPANCTLIDAPNTNLEIKAAISEITNKKLFSIEAKQKQMGSIIACLGEAITHMLGQKVKDPVLMKMIMDAARMTCDLQYGNSLTRRTIILTSLKREMKEQLATTKIDKFLFGKDLADTIKSAKAITRQGAELKAAANPSSRASNGKPGQKAANQHLNWKRAPATTSRNSQKTPKTRQPAPRRSQRETSSRRSRQNTSTRTHN